MSTAPARQARLLDNPDLLRERLRAAPDEPGVYLMRDVDTRVVYVGKSGSLRNRLRSYFTGVESHPSRTRHLVDRVYDFEVIACANEREALILENTLIKRYRPRFNVRLKDDKNYLYLKIPQPGQPDAFAPGTAREAARAPRGEAAARASLFPRPYYSRRMARDGARYFGPYTSAQSLRTTVRSLRTIFPFRTCSDEVFRRGRVCLDYHIKRCAGPCEGRITPEAYAALLEQVQLFMEGRSGVLAAQLRRQMAEAAQRLDYENAARHRDRLRAVERMGERQRMLRGSRADEDVVALALDGAGRGMAAILAVREGKVVGLETHEVEGVAELDAGEVLSSFVGQYYGDATMIPRSVMLSDDVVDREVLADFLCERRGGPVELRVPRRGAHRQLVEQARETAEQALRQVRVKEDFDADRTDALLADLQQRLDLPELPRRIECYDISNTMGTNSVGSMVVFEDGRPRPAHYRHFGIRTVEGANDFASMQETLRRRFLRYLRSSAAGDDVPVDDPAGANGGAAVETDEDELDESALIGVADGDGAVGAAAAGRRGSGVDGDPDLDGAPDLDGDPDVDGEPEVDGDGGVDDGGVDGVARRPPARRRAGRRAPVTPRDDSFGVLPDLVIIDGGRGQLSAAVEVMEEAGLGGVPIVGLAKRNEELFRPGSSDPVVIPADSPTLFLVQRVRDEAHRFAITRHRARRGRAALRSKLDVVPGLGPARRRVLMRHFGGIDRIRDATVEELSELVPRPVALRIKELL